MKPIFIKAGLLLYVWYEVAAELRMGGGATLALTLLACTAAMMHPRLPGRVLAMPRVLLIAAPAAVWFGLAWLVTPAVMGTYPVLALLLAALLALAGAGAHYAVARYGRLFAPHHAMLRGAITPAASLLVGCAREPAILFVLIVVVVLIVLPVRLGWQMISPAIAARSGTNASGEPEFDASA